MSELYRALEEGENSELTDRLSSRTKAGRAKPIFLRPVKAPSFEEVNKEVDCHNNTECRNYGNCIEHAYKATLKLMGIEVDNGKA